MLFLFNRLTWAYQCTRRNGKAHPSKPSTTAMKPKRSVLEVNSGCKAWISDGWATQVAGRMAPMSNCKYRTWNTEYQTSRIPTNSLDECVSSHFSYICVCALTMHARSGSGAGIIGVTEVQADSSVPTYLPRQESIQQWRHEGLHRREKLK